MGKILHVLLFVLVTWNCVAYSYTIRNLYRRMPVDRSSQKQPLGIKLNSFPYKSLKSRQASVEPAVAPNPTLSSSVKATVLNVNSAGENVLHTVRKELSSLGGSIIGGFTGLTGLKLKNNPGFDLPLPGANSIKKTGGSHPAKLLGTPKQKIPDPVAKAIFEQEYTAKLIAAAQAQTQYKRQTGQPNYNAPPYVTQKELPTIWYSNPKPPLHIKIGQDLKGLVDTVFGSRPSKNYQLIPEDNTIDTGLVRDERDSAYGAPVNPVYGAPEQTYESPEPAYGPPETAYGAPESSYDAPETSYNSVIPSYGVPEGEDMLKTMVYGSEEKLPLLLKIITDYNKAFKFYADHTAQFAAFYAPGLIPILKKAGFNVKRIPWVQDLVGKFKQPQDSGYGAPVPSYGEPVISYEPESSYGAPETSYGAPSTTYEQPKPTYGAPAPSYEQPKAEYHHPLATEQIEVYYAPEEGYKPPSHYASPETNYVQASSKRDKKETRKSSAESLDVVPEHHDELVTAVPAYELLKLKKKLNRKAAQAKVDKAEDRSSRLKKSLQKIERIEEIEEIIEKEKEMTES